MDYSLITEEIITERFESLPPHFQELLSSEQVEKLVTQIGKSHFLGREKIEILTQLVSLILLGFINLRDLRQELSERLFLNYANTVSLAKELETEIFNPIRNDLEQIYEPIEAAEAEEGGVVDSVDEAEQARIAEEGGSFTIPVIADGETDSSPKPLIIQNEPQVHPAAKVGASKFGDLSKAFSFFRAKPKDEAPRAASIEVPKEPPKSPDEKRVVHYTELRTPLTPFGDPAKADFINLEAFGKPVDAVTKNAPATVALAEPKPDAPKSEPGVFVEGNRIDLSKI